MKTFTEMKSYIEGGFIPKDRDLLRYLSCLQNVIELAFISEKDFVDYHINYCTTSICLALKENGYNYDVKKSESNDKFIRIYLK